MEEEKEGEDDGWNRRGGVHSVERDEAEGNLDSPIRNTSERPAG